MSIGEVEKMAVLKVLKAPDPELTIVAKPVTQIDKSVHTLVADMLQTMYAEDGMGLAATQVGIHKRVVVMDLNAGDPDLKPDPRCFINPEISWASQETSSYKEGCLSVPEQRALIERPARVKFRYQDETGADHEEEVDGIFATCIQHEIDHLNGKLFIDHLSKLKHDMIIKKLERLKKLSPL